MLLDFAIHRRINETQSRESATVTTMHVNDVLSRGKLMGQARGIVILHSLLIFFHRGSYKITFWELSDTM
jgi:hypothetical protein